MSYPKLWRVVETIKSRTDAGDLKWSKTETPDTFQVAFPKYAARVSRKENSGKSFGAIIIGKYFYLFEVFNEEGELVESATNIELMRVNDDAPSVMQELFEAARRQALGVEEALDSILQDLDDTPPF